MKRHFVLYLLKLKRAFTFNTSSAAAIDIDSVIEENLSLMKEIRANRMRFYKFHRIASDHLSSHN